MASLCFAALIKAHHPIPVPPVQELVTMLGAAKVDPETGEKYYPHSRGETVAVEQPPRPCTDDDIADMPDDVGYRLAMEHLGYTRCEAAFRRFTFDRTGAQIEPDPRAVEFWRNLDHVELMTPSQWRAASRDEPPLPFTVSVPIRERAYAVLGEALADDYMRATGRHVRVGFDDPLYSLGILLLAVLVPDAAA